MLPTHQAAKRGNAGVCAPSRGLQFPHKTPHNLATPHQAAKRVGAPPAFYLGLLSDANALGLPVSAHLAEAALQAAASDAAAFDAAWLHALAHLGNPSRHMVFLAVRSLAARGGGGVAAALALAAEAEAAGGGLSPSVVKFVAQLREQAASGGGGEQQQEGGGEAGGEAVAAAAPAEGKE